MLKPLARPLEVHFHASSAPRRQSFKRLGTVRQGRRSREAAKRRFRALLICHQKWLAKKQRPACARRKQSKERPFPLGFSRNGGEIHSRRLDLRELSLSSDEALGSCEQGSRGASASRNALPSRRYASSLRPTLSPMQAKSESERARESKRRSNVSPFPLPISSPHLVATARSPTVLSNRASKPGRESS